ncbi:BnaC05g03180D [Brassica napus]|uniref:BnaC05g03180D protein n=1 Tax=Brassica napus TaxID=3708 RepID=A0A078IHN9_BRANA|nr:BnaC05g03180D [Brassica napus]
MCIKLDTFSLSVCHAHTLCSILGFCCEKLSPLTLDLACLPVVKLTMIESKQL